MRVLLLHPEDSAVVGPWTEQRWDLVVDLGFAGSCTYEEWTKKLGSRVITIHQFAGQSESFRWVKQVLQCGRGRLVDRIGLDWWEILGSQSFQDLQALYLVHQLRREMAGDQAELAASRRDRLIRIIEQVFGRPVRCFRGEDRGAVRRMRRMFRSARNLRPSQVVEITFDKWDAGYRMRRHAARQSRANLVDSVVLLPSAYSNVTRCVLAYAGQLQQRKFLLATTRRSAVSSRLPENVATASLAAYGVPVRSIRAEAEELTKACQAFCRAMEAEVAEFQQAAGAGIWDYLPGQLRIGLLLRDAWKCLLDTEPITGVLCGDDLNYHTRLPLILARRRGLNAIYCSHGALDGGFLFKTPIAESHLVKGRMEREYLQRASNLGSDRISVAAPGRPASTPVDRRNGALVFFSQPYEVGGGRADAIYQEAIPRLYSVAQQAERKLVIKLHPFESLRARKALVKAILPESAGRAVDVLSDVPPEEVISRAWCGVTVDSSIAVECALRRVPCFLCGWLDFGGMGYLQEFARFGAGLVLDAPADIERIPRMAAEYRPDLTTMQSLWQEADTALLDEVIFGTSPVRLPHPCAS